MIVGVLIPKLSINFSAFLFTLFLSINENVQKSPRLAAERLKDTLSSTKTPSFLLSSGTKAIPLFTASDGLFIFSSLPLRYIFPDVFLYAPNISLQSSDFPAPTSPAIPTISPFLTLKEMLSILPSAPDKFSTLNSSSPMAHTSLGKLSSKDLPSIFSTISLVVVSFVTGQLSTILPFLITV